MQHRPLPVAIVIGLLAEALFLFRVQVPHQLVFDEVHYVPAARTLWLLSGPTNVEHPLVGKLLIGLGIRLFGDGSFGWRALSTLAGTAVVVGIYAILWLLFGRVRTAAFGALLAVFNMTVFIQARIAMLDGFMAAFVVAAVAVLLWAMRRGGWGRWLAGAALLGLAIGTKWTAVPYLGFAGLAFVAIRLRDASVARRPWTTALGACNQPHWPGLASIPALVALGGVAGLIYLLTFAPAFFYASEPLTLATLLPFQTTMYAEQIQVLPHHTYQSEWWSWAPMVRPIWYLYEVADGAQRGILLIGNPAVMWGGLVAVGGCLWAGWRDRSPRLLAAAGLWIASYLIWAAIPKSLGFYYYYYLSSIWLTLAIAAVFDHFRDGQLKEWDGPFLILAYGLFLYFYPIIAATPLAGPGSFHHWMWLNSWP